MMQKIRGQYLQGRGPGMPGPYGVFYASGTSISSSMAKL